MSHAFYIKCNRVLVVVVVVFGLYLALAPLLPNFTFALQHNPTLRAAWLHMPWAKRNAPEAPLVTPRVSMAATEPGHDAAVPKDNTLQIPAIGIDAAIIEGETSRSLEQGIWRRPKSSTPDRGGNTVLVGHRFLYTSGPHTFYHLDKLHVGDKITVYWLQKKYEYVVDSIVTTSPTAVEIEQPTTQPTLTLYTCTPLFSVDKRLVIRAHLVQ